MSFMPPIPEIPEQLVTITAEHVRRGTNDSHSCPVALALKDAGYRTAYVNSTIIRIHPEPGVAPVHCAIIEQLGSLYNWIAQYDGGDPAKPGLIKILPASECVPGRQAAAMLDQEDAMDQTTRNRESGPIPEDEPNRE